MCAFIYWRVRSEAGNGPSPRSNMSSGWILRASSLVEGRGAYLHGLSSGMILSSREYLGGFFPLLEKTGSDKLTGPFQIHHNPKSSLSSGYLLRSLMRTVAMRRMLKEYLSSNCPIHPMDPPLFSIHIPPGH